MRSVIYGKMAKKNKGVVILKSIHQSKFYPKKTRIKSNDKFILN